MAEASISVVVVTKAICTDFIANCVRVCVHMLHKWAVCVDDSC